MHMAKGEYTVFNWSDVDSPSVEVRRTIQTLTMEVSQIMKVGAGAEGALMAFGRGGRGLAPACARPPPASQQPCHDQLFASRLLRSPVCTPCLPPVQGGYTHFMEKEIFEQAETIAQTMQVGSRAGQRGMGASRLSACVTLTTNLTAHTSPTTARSPAAPPAGPREDHPAVAHEVRCARHRPLPHAARPHGRPGGPRVGACRRGGGGRPAAQAWVAERCMVMLQ